MLQPLRLSTLFTFALLCLFAQTALADSPVDPVLQAQEPPPGVVFEIVTGQGDSLNWALPLVKTYIERIRQRFPNLPVAVVTHGREMFALQKSKEKSAAPVHSLTRQLAAEGVALHVCGTYAARRGLNEEDFPGYVNVAAAGPAQINDYVAVGYVLIKLRKPPNP